MRAVLEGVAFSLRDCLEILRELNIPVAQMIAAGGGAKSELWRSITSGVFNVPLAVIPKIGGSEAAFGAAIIAGAAAGAYSSIESACETLCKSSEAPMPENVQSYEKLYGIYRSIYPNLKDVFKASADVNATLD